MKIEGSASAAAGIDYVEVSTDDGVTWQPATGKLNWSYDWTSTGDATYQVRSRVITQDAQVEVPGAGNAVTIDSSLPTTTGTLVADETWTGMVTVTGDVTVPAGVTLTIDPGATIKFQALNDDVGGGDASRSELFVQGTLVATGTSGSPIVFTSTATVPAAGDWGGIVQAGGGDLSLDYLLNIYEAAESQELKQQVCHVISTQENSDASLDAMISIARQETDPEIRQHVVFWIGQYDNDKAAEFLLEIIKHENN